MRTVLAFQQRAGEPLELRLTTGHAELGLVRVPFDFDQVFDADYLFFYAPLLAHVTESDVSCSWRARPIASERRFE
jgi:hypothetical protein